MSSRVVRLSVIIFAFALGLTLPAPAQQTTARRERIVHFPAKTSVGKYEILDLEACERWNQVGRDMGRPGDHGAVSACHLHSDDYWEAFGDVTVPAGKGLVLYVKQEMSGHPLDFLDALQPDDLQVLDLYLVGPLTVEDEKRLARLTGLRALTLGHGWICDETLQELSVLPQLRFLELAGSSVTDAGILTLAKFRSLDALRLGAEAVTARGLERLAALLHLKSLSAGGMTFSRAQLQAVGRLHALEYLRVGSFYPFEGRLEPLAELTNLQELQLDGANLPDSSLASLAGLTRLKALSLSGTGDEGLRLLSRLPTLETLNLYAAHITPASIPTFKQMKSLKYVLIGPDNLNGYSLGDDFFSALHAAVPVLRIHDQIRNCDYPPPAWRQRFESVYTLPAGEAMRRIAPRFIPERAQYFQTAWRIEDRNKIPPSIVFKKVNGGWNSQLPRLKGAQPTVAEIIRLVGDLGADQFSGPPALLGKRVMVADWLIDTSAPLARRFAELEPLLLKEGVKLHFKRTLVEREVIVASGQLRVPPPTDRRTPPAVKVSIGGGEKYYQANHNNAGLADLLGDLGAAIRHPVVNHAESTEKNRFLYELSSSVDLFEDKASPARKRAMLQQGLDELARQTALKFTLERRPVEFWVVTE